MHAGNGLQTADGIACKALFVCKDIIHAYPIDIVNGSGKAVCGYIIRCSGLKLQRRLLKGRLLKADMLYHLTATLVRRQLVEPVLLAVEDAHTGRTIDLMAEKARKSQSRS